MIPFKSIVIVLLNIILFVTMDHLNKMFEKISTIIFINRKKMNSSELKLHSY